MLEQKSKEITTQLVIFLTQELILKAEKEGTHLPKCDIQLPPNYL